MTLGAYEGSKSNAGFKPSILYTERVSIWLVEDTKSLKLSVSAYIDNANYLLENMKVLETAMVTVLFPGW